MIRFTRAPFPGREQGRNVLISRELLRQDARSRGRLHRFFMGDGTRARSDSTAPFWGGAGTAGAVGAVARAGRAVQKILSQGDSSCSASGGGRENGPDCTFPPEDSIEGNVAPARPRADAPIPIPSWSLSPSAVPSMTTPPDRPNPHYNRRQRARMHEKQAWALRQKGYSTRVIARRLDLSQTQVTRLLRAVEDRIAHQAEAIALRVKVRQSCQIEHLLSELMTAWERSKKRPHTTRTKRDGQGQAKETVEVRIPTGDVRFLAEARALLAAERTLWSRDAGAQNAPVIDMDRLRARLIELKELKRRAATPAGTDGAEPGGG